MAPDRRITLDLSHDEALALEQLARRLRWEHLLECAASAAQADAIHDALEQVRRALSGSRIASR